MKCVHCGEELGSGDEYDLYKSHIRNCKSKTAKDYRESLDEERTDWGAYYDNF